MMYDMFHSFLCWVSVKEKNYLHPLLLHVINLIIFKHGQELSSLVNGVEKVLGQLLPLVGVIAVEFVFTKTSKEQKNLFGFSKHQLMSLRVTCFRISTEQKRPVLVVPLTQAVLPEQADVTALLQ